MRAGWCGLSAHILAARSAIHASVVESCAVCVCVCTQRQAMGGVRIMCLPARGTPGEDTSAQVGRFVDQHTLAGQGHLTNWPIFH